MNWGLALLLALPALIDPAAHRQNGRGFPRPFCRTHAKADVQFPLIASIS
mgnify:CR=1 FL=1